MIKLNSSINKNLTQPIIKKLVQNRIITLSDFLQEDVEKLSNMIQLELSSILQIRNDIYKQYSAPVLQGFSLYRTVCSKSTKFITGIPPLDSILDGGFYIGFITEICGLAGSGKTQLCMQLAVNCAKNIEKMVVYVDTKGDFSAIRIQKALEVCGISHKEMAAIMLKIKVVHVWTMEELIQVLLKITNCQTEFNNLSLIIIDSLPSLMFQHFGDDNKIGLKFLNTFVNHARHICKAFEVAVVCVNIQTRWIDQAASDNNDDESSDVAVKEPAYIEKINRCLGKYWQNIPKTVIYLEKCKQIERSNDNKTIINVSVQNCDFLHLIKQCMLTITLRGVI